MAEQDLSVAKSQSDGSLLHFNAARLRVTGSGNLRLSFRSLDDVNVQTLAPLAMQATTNREPTVLANYIDQLGSLRFETTAINETFSICKIVIFVKPYGSSYPQ